MLTMAGGPILAFTFSFSTYFTRINEHLDVAILELPPIVGSRFMHTSDT